MTISDTELESRLRDQRLRADDVLPPPSDLADLTRARYRVERRRRGRLAAAGVAAALFFVGVPTLAATLVAEPDRAPTAASPTRDFVPTPTLFDQPTRGPLAGDEDWLAEVVQRSWLPEGVDVPDPGSGRPNPSVVDRKVAFAGDVPGGRVALVLGRQGTSLYHAWFLGPAGAEPDEMVLDHEPTQTAGGRTVALLDTPDAGVDEALLIVVTFPGGTAEVLLGHSVADGGELAERWADLPMEDGVVVAAAARPYGWNHYRLVRVSGPGSVGEHVLAEFSARAAEAAAAPLDVADPRGLRGNVREDELQWLLQGVVSQVGLPPDRIGPTLLAAGPLGDAGGNMAILVGVTLPDGQRVAGWLAYRGDPNSAGGSSASSGIVAPAVGAGAEPVIAVAAAGTWALIVSGPSEGAAAEVVGEDGTLLATLPLVDGAGTGPHAPGDVRTVRILDASGAVIAESPLQER